MPERSTRSSPACDGAQRVVPVPVRKWALASQACAHSEIRVEPPRTSVGRADSSAARASSSSSTDHVQPAAPHRHPLRLGAVPHLVRESAVVGEGLTRRPVAATPRPRIAGGLDRRRRLRGDQGHGPVRPRHQVRAPAAGEAVQHPALADQRGDVGLPVGVHEVPRPAEPGLRLGGPAPHDREVAQHRVAQRRLPQALHLGHPGRRCQGVPRSPRGRRPRAPAGAPAGWASTVSRLRPRQQVGGAGPRPLGGALPGQLLQRVGERRVRQRRRGHLVTEPAHGVARRARPPGGDGRRAGSRRSWPARPRRPSGRRPRRRGRGDARRRRGVRSSRPRRARAADPPARPGRPPPRGSRSPPSTQAASTRPRAGAGAGGQQRTDPGRDGCGGRAAPGRPLPTCCAAAPRPGRRTAPGSPPVCARSRSAIDACSSTPCAAVRACTPRASSGRTHDALGHRVQQVQAWPGPGRGRGGDEHDQERPVGGGAARPWTAPAATPGRPGRRRRRPPGRDGPAEPPTRPPAWAAASSTSSRRDRLPQQLGQHAVLPARTPSRPRGRPGQPSGPRGRRRTG